MKQENKGIKRKTFYVATTVVVSLLLLLLVASLINNGSSDRVITVQGTHTVKQSPEIAKLSIGIETESSTAEKAEQDNKLISEKLFASLKELGLEETSYGTQSYSLYPKQDWNRGGAITGYTATHSVYIETTDLQSLGTLLDAVSASGANRIYNVYFDLHESTREEAKAEALRESGNVAKMKAEAIAEGLGLRLRGVQQVVDSSYDYYPMYRDFAAGTSVSAVKEEVAIQPNSLDVTASISVTYRLG